LCFQGLAVSLLQTLEKALTDLATLEIRTFVASDMQAASHRPPDRAQVADQTGFWDHDADDADNDGITDGDPMMGPVTPRITRWSSLHSVVDFIVTSFNEKMNLGANSTLARPGRRGSLIGGRRTLHHA